MKVKGLLGWMGVSELRILFLISVAMYWKVSLIFRLSLALTSKYCTPNVSANFLAYS